MEFFLLGTPPPLHGIPLDALLLEVVVPAAEPEPHSFLVHLHLAGQWWKLFSDGPHLHWCQEPGPPVAWDAPEQELTFAVRDLGRELHLQGAVLDAWSPGVVQGAPSVTILFQDGRQLTFQGSPWWSSWSLVTWHHVPDSRSDHLIQDE